MNSSTDSKDPARQVRIHYAWIILIGCCFMEAGSLGGVFDAAGVFFVPVCTDLGFPRAELALYLTFFSLLTIVGMPLVGRWLPKYNINFLLTTMMTLILLAMAAMAFYTEVWQWWISGAVYGFCGSFIFVMPAPIMINNWFQKRRGLALGIGMSCSGIGGAVLSPTFAAIIEAVGWRNGYLLAALIIAVMVLPFTIFVFKFKPADVGLRPYGWSKEDERIVEELREENKKVPGVPAKAALWTTPFACLFLFAGLIPFCGAFNAQLPAHMTQVGFDPIVASTILTAVMLGNVVEKLIVGYLNDRIGVQFTVNIQHAAVALGLLGLIFAGNNLLLIYISAFLFGAQNSLVSVSTPLIIRQLFGNKDFVKLFAWAKVGNGLIGAIWPFLIAFFYDQAGSYIPAFWFGVGVMAASFIAIRTAYARRTKLQWHDLPENREEARKIRFSSKASTL